MEVVKTKAFKIEVNLVVFKVSMSWTTAKKEQVERETKPRKTRQKK